MQLQLPKVNQKVELKLLHGPYAGTYSTFVESVDIRVLSLVRPAMGGYAVPLRAGDPVRVEYAVENTARVGFPTRVMGLEMRVLPVVLLAYPQQKQVEQSQQREFVRLETVLNLTYSVVFLPGYRVPPQGVTSSRTHDISGNGAQIQVPVNYPPGTQLDLRFDVDGAYIRALGQVIRTIPGPGKSAWAGIRFVGIDERDRERLIRHIFEQQRERRAKGLL